MRHALVYLPFFLFAASFNGYAQREALNGLVEKLQEHQQNTLQEKIFVHLDRTFYVGGEIMWFKIYLVDGYFHQSLNVSKVIYLDVLDRNQRPVIQTKVTMENGRGNGSVAIPTSLESDTYTVRAYTNWMKNFSADFYFHQAISIVNVFQQWDDKNKTPELRLDAQFFPEGGQLVEGIKSKVAFRVVDASGKGISFKGTLVTKKGDTLVTFKPLKFGIGHFLFTPKSEEDYQVVIKDKNGRVTLSKLPPVQSTGYVMTVYDTTQNRIKVTIKGKDEHGTSPLIYLIGHSRQIVKTATAQNLINGKISFLLNKKELGEGLLHLTVFNQSLKPVCERLYFNRPTATLSLLMNSDKPVYEPREKIALQVAIKSDDPEYANASLSVFKNDSLQQINPANIQSYLWLTSELKGYIESPEYYSTGAEDMDQAIDNLMLTHGWTKFKWDEVLRSRNKTPHFLPEYRGHLISGKVLDLNSSKPAQGIPAYLSTPDKKIQPYMTYSNADGHVLFETNNLIGNKKLFAQTGAYQNSTRIEIDSPFSEDFATIKTPFLKLNANVKKLLTERSVSMQAEDVFYRGRVLSQNRRGDSSAFYGIASEQYLLDDYTRFPVMEEVMREYVKGVRLRKKDDQFIFKVLNGPKNLIFENEPLILLDGVAVFNTNKVMAMDPLKIKSVEVVTNQYYYGKFTFDGIVSFRTYKGDLNGFQFEPGAIVLDYEGLQSKKEFFSPRYETPTARQSRLPDRRNLLHWVPDLTLNTQPQTIEFYSSDQTGVFQAVIQGISKNGQPVFQTYTFEVKTTDQ
jgi:hypothetical protein